MSPRPEPETFIGRPCRRGHRERYAADGRCVICRRATLRAVHLRRMAQRPPNALKAARDEAGRARAKAKAAGKPYFIGQPCIRGHDGLRLVSCGSCVHCHAIYHLRRTPKQRARARKFRSERAKKATRALRTLEALGIPI